MKIEIGDSRKEDLRTGGDIKLGEIFRIDNAYFISSCYDGDSEPYATVLYVPSTKLTKMKYITTFSYEAALGIGDIITIDEDLIIDEIIHNPTLNWD